MIVNIPPSIRASFCAALDRPRTTRLVLSGFLQIYRRSRPCDGGETHHGRVVHSSMYPRQLQRVCAPNLIVYNFFASPPSQHQFDQVKL